MRLNFISLLVFLLIKIITTKNLKSEKQYFLPLGRGNLNGQRLFVNYLSQANSNAVAISNGLGNANALSCAYAGNSNNLLCKSTGNNCDSYEN